MDHSLTDVYVTPTGEWHMRWSPPDNPHDGDDGWHSCAITKPHHPWECTCSCGVNAGITFDGSCIRLPDWAASKPVHIGDVRIRPAGSESEE